MKKFTNFENEVKPKYESKDSLKNEIFSLIDETISVKITNESSLDKDITINGKEELVEKIRTLIDGVKINERTLTLEHVKKNVYRNFDMKWLNEEIDNTQKIKENFDVDYPRTWTVYLKEPIHSTQFGEKYTTTVYNQKSEDKAIEYAESCGIKRENILKVKEGQWEDENLNN